MTAILFLIAIVVVAIAGVVLAAVPVRHTEGVARSFYWRRSVQYGTPVWVKGQSKRTPSGQVRNVRMLKAGQTGQRSYAYEQLKWRKKRWVRKPGHSQEGVEWPSHELGKNARKRKEQYQATFVAETGQRYRAKMRYARWQSIAEGSNYRLGRNAFGSVRTVALVKATVNPDHPEQAEQKT